MNKNIGSAQSLLDAIGSVRADWIADADRAPARRLHRLPIALLAALICMVTAVSALAAADVDVAYRFLYAISPAAAQQLKPVRLSCEDSGIELEVVSADVQGDTARIYLSLRDLQGDRVDESCDLFDSYQINAPFATSGGCSLARFDPETRTAYFLVEISSIDGRAISGEKLTFSLSCFLSGRREYDAPLPLSAADAQPNPPLQTEVSIRGYDSADVDPAVLKLLQPGTLLSPIDGVAVTGMGWVDGQLHIQTHYADIRDTDAHGWVYLLGGDGQVIESAYSVDFWDADGRGSYAEQIFAVSPEELNDLTLHACFTTSSRITRGDWQLTFAAE